MPSGLQGCAYGGPRGGRRLLGEALSFEANEREASRARTRCAGHHLRLTTRRRVSAASREPAPSITWRGPPVTGPRGLGRARARRRAPPHRR